MKRYTLIGICTLCIWLMTGEGFAQPVRSLVLVFPNNSSTAALGNAGVGLIGSGQDEGPKDTGERQIPPSGEGACSLRSAAVGH